jgi:hypothetical protein
MPSSWDNHAPFVISSSFDDPNVDGLKRGKPKVIVQFKIVCVQLDVLTVVTEEYCLLGCNAI